VWKASFHLLQRLSLLSIIATMLGRLPLALALVTATAQAQYKPQVPVDNRTLAQIYSAAKAEAATSSSKPLRVFWGGDAGSQGDSMRSAWKEAFPEIPLNLTVDLSKYHDNRIDRSWYSEPEGEGAAVSVDRRR
jgi:hypothetical protein